MQQDAQPAVSRLKNDNAILGHATMAFDARYLDQMMPDGGMNAMPSTDLDQIFDGTPTSSALLTPNTMGLINSMWTPSLNPQVIGGSYTTDPTGYFDSAMFDVPSQSLPNMDEPIPFVTSQIAPAQQNLTSKPEDTTAADPPPKKKRRARKKKVRTEEEEARNRENFLERNRKAAQKCRQRKKVWMEDVQQKKDAASELMNILGMQVMHLVDEVNKLRAAAGTHSDCCHSSADPCPTHSERPVEPVQTRLDLPAIDTLQNTRRDSEATLVTTLSTEAPSIEELLQRSMAASSEYSDPCWKLAMEAQKRFNECEPNFVPSMSLLFGAAGNSPSNASSPTSPVLAEDEMVLDDATPKSDQRTDSGFSELSTPPEGRDDAATTFDQSSKHDLQSRSIIDIVSSYSPSATTRDTHSKTHLDLHSRNAAASLEEGLFRRDMMDV